MDHFSAIFDSVRMTSAVYFNAEFTSPWGVAAPPSSELAPALAPGARHLINWHLVTEGNAWARIPGQRPIPLGPGDIVVFPHGDAHTVSSDPESPECRETPVVLRKVLSGDISLLRAGGGGSTLRVVCGFLTCDPDQCRPVLLGLPSAFKVNVRTDDSGKWLESSILHMVDETASGRPGSQAILAKLSEALFVDTLRRYTSAFPEQDTGWLAGARDPFVGKTLGLMHRNLEHPWTVAGLAREVGISRSALVERFTRYLSEPPMTWLNRRRLQLAAGALTRTPKGVAEIAAEVGYESEAAFSRAFRREFGAPPARYRRDHRSSAGAISPNA